MGRVIDAHVHLFMDGFLPRKWYESVAAKWSASRFPPIERSAADVESGLVDPDAELLMNEIDEAGVDAALCLTLDWGIHLGDAAVPIREVHRTYGQLQSKLQNRFYAVGGVDPRRRDALEIARDALEVDGLHGIKLYPPSGFYPGDRMCYPIYELCQSVDRPVVFHTALIGYPHDSSFANPLGVIEVQKNFPDLKIVLAHSGHPTWGHEAIEVAAAHPHTYLELSNWNHELHTDTGRAHLRATLAHMRNAVGAHRMLFASDHLGGRRFSGGRSGMGAWKKFISGLGDAEEFGRRRLSPQEIELILGENAARVFGLS